MRGCANDCKQLAALCLTPPPKALPPPSIPGRRSAALHMRKSGRGQQGKTVSRSILMSKSHVIDAGYEPRAWLTVTLVLHGDPPCANAAAVDGCPAVMATICSAAHTVVNSRWLRCHTEQQRGLHSPAYST
jgi:hypothetical protein